MTATYGPGLIDRRVASGHGQPTPSGVPQSQSLVDESTETPHTFKRPRAAPPARVGRDPVS